MVMSNPSQQELLEAIDKGIRNAQRDYKKAYESDIGSNYAPEYLITVYIFQSILETVGRYGLSLEEPVLNLACLLRKASTTSHHSCGRYADDLRVYGKCDLSLKKKDDKPMTVIEVKQDPWDYYSDIKRLASLVKMGLPFGIFASCHFVKVIDDNSDEADIQLEEEAKCILEEIKSDFKRRYELDITKHLGFKNTLKLDGDSDYSRWCSFCFVITAKSRYQ